MHVLEYMTEAAVICKRISHAQIDGMAKALSELKGKLYIAGMGGSLANAIHMAADLRKLCDIDAEAFDNIAEITARVNDEGVGAMFGNWLSRATPKDALMILSVGGGTSMVSQGIFALVDQAELVGCKIYGIVGPHGGYTADRGDLVIRIPVENPKHVTPHTEAFQAVIWHCLVSHPLLQKNKTKW